MNIMHVNRYNCVYVHNFHQTVVQLNSSFKRKNWFHHNDTRTNLNMLRIIPVALVSLILVQEKNVLVSSIINETYNEHYISVIDSSDTYNFYQAKDYCIVNYGSSLASIHNISQLNSFQNILFKNDKTDFVVWIGLNDILYEGNWTYTDGTQFDSSTYNMWFPWGANQPDNNSSVGEDCVAYLQLNHSFYDYSCDTNHSHQFVCNRHSNTNWYPIFRIVSNSLAFGSWNSGINRNESIIDDDINSYYNDTNDSVISTTYEYYISDNNSTFSMSSYNQELTFLQENNFTLFEHKDTNTNGCIYNGHNGTINCTNYNFKSRMLNDWNYHFENSPTNFDQIKVSLYIYKDGSYQETAWYIFKATDDKENWFSIENLIDSKYYSIQDMYYNHDELQFFSMKGQNYGTTAPRNFYIHSASSGYCTGDTGWLSIEHAKMYYGCFSYYIPYEGDFRPAIRYSTHKDTIFKNVWTNATYSDWPAAAEFAHSMIIYINNHITELPTHAPTGLPTQMPSYQPSVLPTSVGHATTSNSGMNTSSSGGTYTSTSRMSTTTTINTTQMTIATMIDRNESSNFDLNASSSTTTAEFETTRGGNYNSTMVDTDMYSSSTPAPTEENGANNDGSNNDSMTILVLVVLIIGSILFCVIILIGIMFYWTHKTRKAQIVYVNSNNSIDNNEPRVTRIISVSSEPGNINIDNGSDFVTVGTKKKKLKESQMDDDDSRSHSGESLYNEKVGLEGGGDGDTGTGGEQPNENVNDIDAEKQDTNNSNRKQDTQVENLQSNDEELYGDGQEGRDDQVEPTAGDDINIDKTRGHKTSRGQTPMGTHSTPRS